MLDCVLDGIIDTLKLLPYLFIAFLLLEFLEHKLSKKNEKLLEKNQKFGPIVGGVLGALPQCGFSAMASSLFSSRVITMGTLIAVFLSTSDEMLPIMISERASVGEILPILGFKIVVGVVVGIVVDLLFSRKREKHPDHTREEIHHMCLDEDCDCEHENIFVSSLKHTLKIAFFVLVANLVINLVIYWIGEDTLSSILLTDHIYTKFLASLVGLIPNCASSVILTELYLSNLVTLGTLLAGLLTGSGLGILLLFRSNKNMKENFSILGIIYFVGVIVGVVVDILL